MFVLITKLLYLESNAYGTTVLEDLQPHRERKLTTVRCNQHWYPYCLYTILHENVR